MNQRLGRVGVALLVAWLAGCGPLKPGSHLSAPTSGALLGDLPQPSPIAVLQTSPEAQIAWLSLQSPGQYLDLIGINGSGRQVARLNGFSATVGGPWRSADGKQILIADGAALRSFNALNGDEMQTYHHSVGQIVGQTFSPDSRYLALLLFSADRLQLEAIDLTSGRLRGPVPVPHAADAPMPGMQGPPSAWAAVTFAPDSLSLYTLSDWGGQPLISAFRLTGDSLHQLATAPLPTGNCGGPATPIRVVDAGAGLAAFCHPNGAVWLMSLRTLGQAVVLDLSQSNPFAASPVFTPDGQILFVVEGNRIQAVDLHRQRPVPPVQISMRKATVLAAIASLFVQEAEAGWVASTTPISPDGLSLYLAGWGGVKVLRIPTLEVLRTLVGGSNTGEVWVSGDGRTLFATASDGARLLITGSNGGPVTSIALPAGARGFISNEHG